MEIGLFNAESIRELLKAHTHTQRIQRASTARIPRRLGAYDSETDGFHNCTDPGCVKCHGKGRIPKPFIHGIYFGDPEEYHEFDTIEALVAFLEKQKALFYAHNGGKFDYFPLRPYMNTDEPVMLINGRIARFRIGECEFRDSLNIFPNTRLSDFGVKTEIDYDKMEPAVRDIPEVRREISLYLRQDCKGLYDQVTRFRSEYGTGLTQAGTMMKRWEKRHYQQDAPRQSKAQFEQCRPFYYGGRVQCFVAGVQAVGFQVADINSAYPRAMLEAHPISPAPSESRRLPRDEAILKTSLIRLSCCARGCFPWRSPRDGNSKAWEGELFFPEDELRKPRRYYITGWELIAALEMNAVTTIHIEEVLTFSQTRDFQDYILPAYEARLQAKAMGDKAGVIFKKYEMNGLYGKFGADPSNYAEYVIATTDTVEGWKAKGFKHYQDWGEGKWMMERPPSESDLKDMTSRWRYYNVATAASITGFVRAFLFKALSRASGVLYCDTDSIAARSLTGLDYGKELGQWKDEGAFDRYAIAGKKLYAFHVAGAPEPYDPKAGEKDPPEELTWKIASKGVAFHTDPDGPNKIIELAQGGEIEYRPQVPTYSVIRDEPIFINRSIVRTAKDIRKAPWQPIASV